MKCNQMDLVRHVEGHMSVEMEKHLMECATCREDLDRFSRFFKDVLPVYRAAKSRDAELNRQLAAMKPANLRPLPAIIARKVEALKNESLTSRLKDLLGTHSENTKELIESILHPQAAALPASPRDMAGSPAKKTQRKKAAGKKRQGRRTKE